MSLLLEAKRTDAVPRKGDYLFKRAGSGNWWIRFQYPHAIPPNPKKVEFSLGTFDRTQAELKALPLIQEHRAKVLVRRALVEGRLRVGKPTRAYEAGREHRTAEGQRVVATERDLIYLDEAGRIIRTEPNLDTFYPWEGFTPEELREIEPMRPKRNARSRNDDLTLLETWIKHRGIKPYEQSKARHVYETFKELVNGKGFANCTREDGRKLVAHLQAQGLKSATIQKHVGYLSAAVNIAIGDGKLNMNPFSKVVSKADDALVRLPFDEDDMALVRSRLTELDSEERLLWTWLANTGMRLSEPCQISEEFRERGIRFVRVGTKTEQSDRFVPIPDDVLAFIPEKITGPVFTADAKHLGRRLMRFLRRIGITDERKVIHSLRHRAKDRLRAEGCPEDIQLAILGHEKKTVSAGYGKGYPLAVLKHWIERVGG
jgi:integrase